MVDVINAVHTCGEGADDRRLRRLPLAHARRGQGGRVPQFLPGAPLDARGARVPSICRGLQALAQAMMMTTLEALLTVTVLVVLMGLSMICCEGDRHDVL
jgi:hypothetical protein